MYLGRAIDLKYQYLVDSAFCAANVHLDVNSQVRCASSSPSSTCSLRALVEPNLLLRRPHFVSENLIFGRSKSRRVSVISEFLSSGYRKRYEVTVSRLLPHQPSRAEQLVIMLCSTSIITSRPTLANGHLVDDYCAKVRRAKKTGTSFLAAQLHAVRVTPSCFKPILSTFSQKLRSTALLV